MKPEQVTSLLVKTIEDEFLLTERLKIKPLKMASAAMVKITSESLDGIHLSKHEKLVFMKEGLQNMIAMMVVPKSACIGIIAAQLAAYYSIYLRVQRTAQKESWATRSEWMKEVTELFKNGTEVEFEMSCPPATPKAAATRGPSSRALLLHRASVGCGTTPSRSQRGSA